MNGLPFIRLIGGVQINNESATLTHKALEIFVVLATQAGQAVTVNELLRELWEEGYVNSREVVYAQISLLRRKLKGVTVRTESNQHGYRLLVDPNDIDLHVFIDAQRRFRHLLETGNLDAADRLYAPTMTLTKGSLFGGLRCGEILSGWKTAYAEHLAAWTRDWLELRLRQGRHREIVTELLVVCQGRPHDEDLAAKLMLALYRCNRRIEVIQVYQRLNFALRTEYGLDVSSWVKRLHQLVLADDESLNNLDVQFSV